MTAKLHRLFRVLTLLSLTLWMLACTPALNWRKSTLNDAHVQLLMPCKPEHATRSIPIQPDINVQLTMMGCEASDMHFTVSHMQVPQSMTDQDLYVKWQKASLISMGAEQQNSTSRSWSLKGALESPAPERVQIRTAQHHVHMVWFVFAGQIYQAAVYGKPQEKQLPDAAQTFFSGIELL